MNRLVFSLILLLGWIIFIAFDQGFLFAQIAAVPKNTANNNDLNNSPVPSIRGNLGIEDNSLQENNLQNQIQSELYNSISTGMSYEEVRSIIGWDGVLLYENEVNHDERMIQTKVYQWNKEDVYSTNSSSATYNRLDNLNLYENITLEFQDNFLINKDFSDSKP